MYDIKQFRPALFVLLLLGFAAYGYAAQEHALILLALAVTAFNWWLDAHGRFRPIGRMLANIITLGSAVAMILRFRSDPVPIMSIGGFLILLQLVKLYERRGNRDLAQLLVLSLLLMVAGAMSTPSMVFGLALIAYLFLSLYCCLLFHLKVETDHAKVAMQIDESRMNPMTLKQDQRYLPSSMRRLTSLVAMVSVAMALIVFLFFPRGAGAGLIGAIPFRASSTMTGFSDSMSFQDVARLTQNTTEVGYVEIQRNGQSFGSSGEPIYIRGSVLDHYNADPADDDRWKWERTGKGQGEIVDVAAESERGFSQPRDAASIYVQKYRLLPTGREFIFSMSGLATFRPGRPIRVRYNWDGVLQTVEPLVNELNYSAVSYQPVQGVGDLAALRRAGAGSPVIPAALKQIAMQDNVCGTDAKGNLATQRVAQNTGVSDFDETIAQNFVNYFHNNFTYSTDLTDAGRDTNKDPLVQFVTEFKRGHCEYFAGAMALMCQSLGMQARVVVGFCTDDYNPVGGYYTIRQNHAHAWVEVLTPRGWVEFDPTASTVTQRTGTSDGFMASIKKFFNYLDYAWGNKVVNYDAETRMNVISSLDTNLSNAAAWLGDQVNSLRQKFTRSSFYSVTIDILSGMLGLLGLGALVAIGFFLYERWRLRRVARRIGLDALPSTQQVRLARQLTFYDDLLQLLDRHDIHREPAQTPLEFSRSIGYLPGDVFLNVQRLTRLFYRVRYGEARLDAAQQRRLARVVARVSQLLENPTS